MSSTPQQFGRAWELIINTVPDENGESSIVCAMSNSFAMEALRITFDVELNVTSDWLWSADISIYNLTDAAANLVITQGMTVTLSAGYMNQPYGIIFSGTIYKPTWEIENVVDYKLTLHCIVALESQADNFAAFSFKKGISQRDLIATMAASAKPNPIQLTLDPASEQTLSGQSQSRGGIFFGNPQKYFEQATRVNQINYWAEQKGAFVRSLIQKQDNIPTITIGVGSGLIGTPVQTQYGVDCKILLNPIALPAMQFVLDQSVLIKQLAQRPDGSAYPSVLLQGGSYAILRVRHVGDSRGNDWYTYLTGSLYAGELLEALQGGAA